MIADQRLYDEASQVQGRVTSHSDGHNKSTHLYGSNFTSPTGILNSIYILHLRR